MTPRLRFSQVGGIRRQQLGETRLARLWSLGAQIRAFVSRLQQVGQLADQWGSAGWS